MPKTTCSIQILKADSLFKVPQMCKFENHVTRNDVIMMSLPNNEKQWKNADLGGTKQYIYIYIVGKVLMRAIENCNFIEFEPLATVSKVMGIYVKFAMTTHQIWSCHVTMAPNSENFYFSPNSILNFRKTYHIWGKLAKEQKVTGKKQIGGGKHPPCL